MTYLFKRLDNTALEMLKIKTINTWTLYLMEENRERGYDSNKNYKLFNNYNRLVKILSKRYSTTIEIDGNDQLIFSTIEAS